MARFLKYDASHLILRFVGMASCNALARAFAIQGFQKLAMATFMKPDFKDMIVGAVSMWAWLTVAKWVRKTCTKALPGINCLVALIDPFVIHMHHRRVTLMPCSKMHGVFPGINHDSNNSTPVFSTTLQHSYLSFMLCSERHILFLGAFTVEVTWCKKEHLISTMVVPGGVVRNAYQ
jgi:hypothetical protein